jgi:aminopeptidase YwaD
MKNNAARFSNATFRRDIIHADAIKGAVMQYRVLLCISLAAVAASAAAAGHAPPLLPEAAVAALANELSGETAKRNLEGLARFHRQRGSQGFHSAVELVAERARAYGLRDVRILQYPADGKIYYGPQRSRPAWDAEQGELEEIKDGRGNKIASYAAEPIVLAEDSETADVTADLVDVGPGVLDSDYAGKDVKGKIVLAAAQPGEVQDLAIGKLGAAGIVSYAQNQKTAWSGQNGSMIRWGHLQSFSPYKTFAFMVSLDTARAMQERLMRNETIRLHASVQAGQHPGFYEIGTAVIPGADAKLKDEEIAFSCHLDHQRPGANDNASGCVAILEVARTLATLISRGELARPARSIRFLWPPEVEGTVTLLNADPKFARQIKAVVHMDMVGGGPETKAVFHVTRGPRSLPSFVHDVAWAFADWANEESYRFAATGAADYPLIAPEGGREPLRAMYSPYTMGSDHEVYQDSSFGIPAIYLNDWPDRYIHTNLDTAANIDPTKLKRAAFIGAASGYFLANFSPRDTAAADRAIAAGKLSRIARAMESGAESASGEDYERAVRNSVASFNGAVPAGTRSSGAAAKGPGAVVYRRLEEPRGPLAVFGYDYFADHVKRAGLAAPKLLSYEGAWGGGEEYAYEALNFADGKRNAQRIADELSAEYGPVPLELVVEYLRTLKEIGVVE